MTSVEKVTIPEGYKQTEVGVIPEDWVEVPYSENFNIISGVGFNKSEYVQSGLKLVRIDNVSYGFIKWSSIAYLPERYRFQYEKLILEEKDILLALNRPITNGKLKIAVIKKTDLPSILYQRVGKIIFLNSIVDRGYAYYILSKFIKKFVEDTAVGTDQPFISTTNLKKCLLPFPVNLKEQTAIANALSDVDNLIASLETLIAKKSAIKTAAMQQLLTGKKRLPAFVKESDKQSSELDNTSETAQAAQAKQASTLNSDLYKESGEGLDVKSNQYSEVSNANNKQTAPRPGYKQSELGEIPEDWEVMSIGHALERKLILDQMDGNHGELYPKSYEFSDFGIPYVGATDFHNGKVNFSTCKYLPIERAKLFKKGIAKNSDVLFAHNATVGPVALLESDFEFIILSTTATYYRCDETKINNKYLASYFESQLFVNQYTSVMSQSTRNQVPILTQRKFKLVLPTMIEQTAIANVLSDMDTELVALQQRLSKTQKIKQGMMQELLTGKTRLV